MAASADERADLLDLNFAQVLGEERRVLDRKRADRGAQGARFSLAFSGGGIRAAAFQSGVLWRLAQAGRLKDVDYLAAVSGGAYIASAFASHLLAAEPPAEGLDQWYLDAAAKTVCRMQRNAGDFVRDPGGEGLSAPKDAAGALPRLLDLPMLLVVLVLTILVNPLQFLVVYVVPLAEAVHLFFGAGLRAAYCASTSGERWDMLMRYSPLPWCFSALDFTVLFAFLAWLACRPLLGKLGKPKGPSRPDCSWYLFFNAMRACLVRLSFILALLICMVVLLPELQVWQQQMDLSTGSTRTTRHDLCTRLTEAARKGDPMSQVGCADYFHGVPWFKDTAFWGMTSQVKRMVPPFKELATRQNTMVRSLQGFLLTSRANVVSLFLGVLLFALVVSVVVMPVFPGLVFHVVSLGGPLGALCVVLLIVQYRIYGPMNNQSLLFEWFPFDQHAWNTFIFWCLAAACVLIPFYNECQRLWHLYYVRCLQTNFFHDGRDVHFHRLLESVPCPLLLLTGTVSDYKRPGSTKAISEISFSSLHTGSEDTRYIRTPPARSLAKCTALSAAGCLDAISLSMTSKIRFRFWLELLNLSWGDYILFKKRDNWAVRRSWVHVSDKFGARMTWLVCRVPHLIIAAISGALFAAGWWAASSSGMHECKGAKIMVTMSLFTHVGLFMLSFFAYAHGLGWMMFSPQYRQFHQATMFTFERETPPGLIYVTDGGVQDCTGILQLMRRQCERILLVLAAADPSDELGVLRSAMAVAANEKLASFYDPEDPRRDIRIMMDAYKADRSKSCLHIGIRYGWEGSEEGLGRGTLVVVKNRLPPALEQLPVQPRLTEEEIKGSSAWGHHSVHPAAGIEYEVQRGMKVSELGGLGCCDCCHRRGCNCGGKFPHLTGANYLWLTPQLFNSLCRLGREVSEEAIDLITK